MSKFSEGAESGDARDIDRDGMLFKDREPETHHEADTSGAYEESTDISPFEPIMLSPYSVDREERRHGSSFSSYRSRLAGLSFLSGLYELAPPQADGSEYVKDAFGGFGPGSPEYDSERRLKIIVPDAKAAVGWFRDTVIEPDTYGIELATTKDFSARMSSAQHPGVQAVSVSFLKSRSASLVAGKIDAHVGAFTVADAPKTTEEGIAIDTRTPAASMMARHMQARLEDLYPGRVQASQDGKVAAIELDANVTLHINCNRLPQLSVTANGSFDTINPARYGQTKATPKQLELELKAIQEHFPAIAEAHADFFRKQLPASRIEVEYRSASDEGKGAGKDPVNPERLAALRQELITEPRGDDFKYIGGLDADIAKLKEIAMGFSHPEAFHEFGVTPPRGVLLYGPPGTGKTSLVNAFARDVEGLVLTLKASTLKSAFHGETERNIRGAFQLADELVADGERVIIFIDELEALAPARDAMGSSGIDKNVTTELLQGMNVDRKNCIIIAATNVPGMVDPALVNNSSRFSEQLEIGLPNMIARQDIIQKLFLKFADRSANGSREALFAASIQIETIAQASEGLSGADIENAIRKVLFTKAVILASTGIKPGPATNGEIYQSIKNVALGKHKTGNNYLG